MTMNTLLKALRGKVVDNHFPVDCLLEPGKIVEVSALFTQHTDEDYRTKNSPDGASRFLEICMSHGDPFQIVAGKAVRFTLYTEDQREFNIYIQQETKKLLEIYVEFRATPTSRLRDLASFEEGWLVISSGQCYHAEKGCLLSSGYNFLHKKSATDTEIEFSIDDLFALLLSGHSGVQCWSKANICPTTFSSASFFDIPLVELTDLASKSLDHINREYEYIVSALKGLDVSFRHTLPTQVIVDSEPDEFDSSHLLSSSLRLNNSSLDLSTVCGQSFNAAQLPSTLLSALNIQQGDITLLVDPQANSIDAAIVRLSSRILFSETIAIIPGFLELEAPALFVSIDSPFAVDEGSTVMIAVDSGLELFGLRFNTSCQLLFSDDDDDTLYSQKRLSASLAQELRFSALLRSLHFPSIDFLDIAIEEFDVHVDISSGAWQGSITLAVEEGGEAEPPRLPFGLDIFLTEIDVDIRSSGIEGGSVFVSVGADLDIFGGSARLNGHSTPGGNGWKLSALLADLALSAATLGEELKRNFNLALPAAIADFSLNIDKLELNYDTANASVVFRMDTFLESISSRALLEIHIQPQPSPDKSAAYSSSYFGAISLALGEEKVLHFELLSAQENDGASGGHSALIAHYKNPNGVEIPLDSLLNQLIDPALSIQTGLHFSIKEAYIANLSDANTTQTTHLLGFDIDAGLDLANLHIEDMGLPLISSNNAIQDPLRVGFKAKYVSTEKDTIDLSKFASSFERTGILKGDTGDLKTVAKGLSLDIGLDLGGKNVPLSLPISLHDSEETGAEDTSGKQSNGLVKDETKNTDTSNSKADKVSRDGTEWVNIQQHFGPVDIERVGFNFKDGLIHGYIDASLGAFGLDISLDGLSVSTPLDKIEPRFLLQGLGIEFQRDPVLIRAAFLKQDEEFAGLASIKIKQLMLSAAGGYGVVKGHPSLFLYAVLDYPIGGPAFFFVEGLAAGFGYNRNITVPGITGIDRFPLVANAMNPAGKPDIAAARSLISEYSNVIRPAIGENFLAAGVKFNSFKQVDSFALLICKFGTELEIDLLGLSTLKVPSNTDNPVAVISMAMKASFTPRTGELLVQAQLTSDSYVFSKECRLSGGFAFAAWTSGPHRGDFVTTVGGYHPLFVKPDHYPTAPRLGMNWRVNTNLTIKGTAYYALCPHVMMAGGRLEVHWHAGGIQADLLAGVDFLIEWEPFHYDAHAYISIHAYIEWLALSIDASADLHIWGPEFAGIAHVDVEVLFVDIDFDIQLGAAPRNTDQSITWARFKEAFLPEDTAQWISASCSKGLINELTGEETANTKTEDGTGSKIEGFIVQHSDFSVEFESVVPFHSEDKASSRPPGIFPCKLDRLQEDEFLVHVTCLDTDSSSVYSVSNSQKAHAASDGGFVFEPIYKDLPASLWGEPGAPELNEKERILKDAHVGYRLRSKFSIQAGDKSKPIEGDKFFDIQKRSLRQIASSTKEPQWDTVSAQSKSALENLCTPSAELLSELGFDNEELIPQQYG